MLTCELLHPEGKLQPAVTQHGDTPHVSSAYDRGFMLELSHWDHDDAVCVDAHPMNTY